MEQAIQTDIIIHLQLTRVHQPIDLQGILLQVDQVVRLILPQVGQGVHLILHLVDRVVHLILRLVDQAVLLILHLVGPAVLLLPQVDQVVVPPALLEVLEVQDLEADNIIYQGEILTKI